MFLNSMRSGSAALGRKCPQGFGSVQEAHEGVEEGGASVTIRPPVPTAPTPPASPSNASSNGGLDIALAVLISVGAILAVIFRW